LQISSPSHPSWLSTWMKTHNISLWGAADLREFSTPTDATGQKFPIAISWVIPMNPQIMFGIQQGPNQVYADEYSRVNNQINKLAAMLVAVISSRGFRAQELAASDRTDPVNIMGDFPLEKRKLL
jgi:epoxyqueuosine reductase